MYVINTTAYHLGRREASSPPTKDIHAVVPDLAKICHFGNILQVFSKLLTFYFLSGKMLILFWRICYIIGLIFIVENGQILKNNLTIWSHCLHGLTFANLHFLTFSGLHLYIIRHLCPSYLSPELIRSFSF